MKRRVLSEQTLVRIKNSLSYLKQLRLNAKADYDYGPLCLTSLPQATRLKSHKLNSAWWGGYNSKTSV